MKQGIKGSRRHCFLKQAERKTGQEIRQIRQLKVSWLVLLGRAGTASNIPPAVGGGGQGPTMGHSQASDPN